MQLFVTVVHILLCIFLILVILLQPGKDSAQLLGGGVNSMYGQRANAHPLSRATTVIAALFMVTSITLALYSSERAQSGSDVEDRRRQLEEEEAARKKLTGPAPVIPEPAVEAPPVDAGALDLTAPPAPEGDALSVPATPAPTEAPATPAGAPAGGP